MATLFVIVGGTSTTADAGPYDYRYQSWLAHHSPWCLRTMGGVDECGYATLAQCNVSRSGVGGNCNPNPRYMELPPDGPPRRSRGKRFYR